MRIFNSALLFILLSSAIFAQDNSKLYEFSVIKKLSATEVKNQGNTGTCWSFATTSFIESEMIRLGNEPMDLSEMWNVRNCYIDKADKYIRYHGTSNFGEGGQAHDVMMSIKENGLVPQSAYTGFTYSQEKYNHAEMTSALKSLLDGVMNTKQNKLTPKWKQAFASVLDVYLGEAPDKFEYNGQTYTPKNFVEKLGFNPGEYIEFTSYSHHPFNEKIMLEIPDNWTNSLYCNVPVDDLMAIINNALENGYTVCWDGDTGKDHFYRSGYAVVPAKDDSDEVKTDSLGLEVEKEITQADRQEAFDNYDTTDDHLMHIIGTAKDQNGKLFYLTKNSWGTRDKGFDGYWYMSGQYIKLKTVAIMVHKDAVPKSILSRF